jgi:hemolysin activation/secretion protein
VGGTNASPRFDVRAYVVNCDRRIFTNTPTTILAEYTGTNVSREGVVQAAAALLSEYQRSGHPRVSISIAQELITNGIVTMNVYEGAFPQVLISGKPCFSPREAVASPIFAASAPSGTNAPAGVRTNAEPRFTVIAYEITGDTLLSTDTLMSIFAKRTGTNVGLADIKQAAADLQLEYRNRRFPTVVVTIPEQKLTNGIVKLRVYEGRLSEILVTQNHYFSSNNVMRALPSLHTNIILNSALFQAELDRANANQDRQIYPRLQPGLQENTTALDLEVKDRLPLHAKVDFNNQNTPGTPDLRVNTSASYQNLWQLEHSIGVQYGFSPELYKTGSQWSFYDEPLVANYSGFYRLPLGNAEPVEQTVARQPESFGYDEASRRFRLPPSSGRAELNVYASRSTIDTGLMTLDQSNLTPTNDAIKVVREDVQQDLTINEDAGFRLSDPFASSSGLLSTLSAGPDWKRYDYSSVKTNLFIFTTIIRDQNNIPVKTNVAIVPSAVPRTHRDLEYCPLALRYDGSLNDRRGTTRLGLGVAGNAWYSGSETNLQILSGSRQSTGYWVTLNPTLFRDFVIWTNWVMSLRADGQWSSEPLISNEQYGLGGINTIRGYHEGEVYGDTGWHVSLEQGTPTSVLGTVYGKNRLALRGTVYMDYGEVYLLDPRGRQASTSLWGTGFGAVLTAGPTWQARFLFSWPLLNAGTTAAMSPRFDFSLSAQF